jgi:hypothetical protein
LHQSIQPHKGRKFKAQWTKLQNHELRTPNQNIHPKNG